MMRFDFHQFYCFHMAIQEQALKLHDKTPKPKLENICKLCAKKFIYPGWVGWTHFLDSVKYKYNINRSQDLLWLKKMQNMFEMLPHNLTSWVNNIQKFLLRTGTVLEQIILNIHHQFAVVSGTGGGNWTGDQEGARERSWVSVLI